MFARGVAVLSVLALAAVAQGGVAVQLVPNPNLPAYSQGQVVQVDVKLSQAPGGSDQRLRMVEFDLQNTHSFFTVALPLTHERNPGVGDDIHFWSFTSLPTCVSTPSFCGFNHFIDDNMAVGPVDTREKTLSIAFAGLTADGTAQILLPASGAPVTIGKLTVTMPAADNDYTLDLVNATATGADQGARVDFGHDPHTIWRAKLASPNEVSGGRLTFHVGAQPTGACCVNGNTCHTGVTQAACANQSGVWQGDGSTSCVNCPATTNAILVSSIPAFTAHGIPTVPAMGTLWRSAGNVARLTFDRAVGLPTAGQILIQEMLAGGVAGPDLSASFAFTLESGNTVLRIRDGLTATPTSTLLHRKWYVIRNTGGWAGVANFEAQFPSQAGDSAGNNNVVSADTSLINAGIPCLSGCGDANRKDINGDQRVTSVDTSLANSVIPSFAVAKPSGW